MGLRSSEQRVAINHSPLATRHSPLAIRHSPLAIRHSPLAIRHSPFATRFLNMLRLRLLPPAEPENTSLWLTLQYALKRGLKTVFELEENELDTELVGSGCHCSLLIYEVPEGGVGVLRRLLKDPLALGEVAHAALELCHVQFQNGRWIDTRPDCPAACYECLLTFFNQYEALHLNRHQVLPLLAELADSTTELRFGGRTCREHFACLWEHCDGRSPLERHFLEVLRRKHCLLPTEAQKVISVPSCRPDFFYAPNICVFCDGTVHRDPLQADRDRQLRNALEQAGYRVIVLALDRMGENGLKTELARYPDVFFPYRS
jgi:hypothetical protein